MSVTRKAPLCFSLLGFLLSTTAAQAQLLTGFDEEEGASYEQPEAPVTEAHTPQDIPEVQAQPQPEPQNVSQPTPLVPQQQPKPSYKPFITTYDKPPPSSQKKGAPVDIEANTFTRDEENNTVSASGDVFIVQEGRILRADQVNYNVNTDTAVASGNVVLNDTSGDVHLADQATYNDRLENGTVTNLRTTMSDGARLTAVSGERRDGVETIAYDASYTPCKICGEDDPDDPPLWGLRAAEVKHDQENHRVTYKHARFEAMGVPIAYTPYFSHPDGTIKQKSGFLSPGLGFKTDLGGFVETEYYWAIAPDQDATVGVTAFTNELPLGLAQYRKRWDDAYFEFNGGITTSERKDDVGGTVVTREDELRGHVFADAIWDINDMWRAGLDVNYASDDQYIRQYDLVSNDTDVLENQIYAERFSGRNYASARLLAFQDIRIRDIPVDQPNVLPELYASFKGEPGNVPLIKGQWDAEISGVSLLREGNEQDVMRTSLDLGWNRRLVSDFGFLTSVDLNARGDVYHISDRATTPVGSGQSRSGYETRFYPQAHIETSYPMARPFDTYQARVEPVVALTFAPNLTRESDIPNEDSNNVQIDASNLFERNRFPGMDRVEDQSRVTYGLRSGLFAYDGSFADVFVGQSYRFDEGNNPFPAGSGLENQESDYVGQISASYKNIYDLDYRFQLGSRDFRSERHEVDFIADWNRTRFDTTYLYAGELADTDIDESREQLDANLQYYWNKAWRSRVGATQDLGEDPGLREAYLGLDYFNQCLFWSFTAVRNLTNEATGDSDTELLFRIGLKNLGEFEESTLRNASESCS